MRPPPRRAPSTRAGVPRNASRWSSRRAALRRSAARWRAGQDIYAVSAPLVVEAAQRLLARERDLRGALSLAQAFDARDFLGALAPGHLALEIG